MNINDSHQPDDIFYIKVKNITNATPANIKVGDITWCTNSYKSNLESGRCVHPEDNNHYWNAWSADFDIVDIKNCSREDLRTILTHSAKMRYKVGDKLICASESDETHHILGSLDFESGAMLSNEGEGFYVYFNGKWADRIERVGDNELTTSQIVKALDNIDYDLIALNEMVKVEPIHKESVIKDDTLLNDDFLLIPN